MPQALQIARKPSVTNRPLGFDNMLKVVSPDRLISAEKAEAERRKAELAQNEPTLQDLGHYVRKLWFAAYTAKQTTGTELGSPDERLMQCLRQRLGLYDPDKLDEIRRQNRSEIFMLVTNIKCRAAQAWLEDVLLQPMEPVFDLDPTPIPTLPEAEEVSIKEQVILESATLIAEKRMMEGLTLSAAKEAIPDANIADRIGELREKVLKEKVERAKVATRFQARKIEDEFQEGGFYQALRQFINDFCTFPAAFLKGPIVRKERVLTWVEDGKGGYIPKIGSKFKRIYQRVSPFNAYPSPGARNIQDGYFCERHRGMRRRDFMAMIGVPGFDERAIRAVLDLYGQNGLQDWIYNDTETDAALSRDGQNDPDPGIDAIEFWGSIQGKLLREWGMKPAQVPDPEADYPVNVWLVGSWVICARINPMPLGQRPYYSASYEGVPDCIWGKCPPELMRDLQQICNAAARAAVDNMGIASGPMADVNMDRVEPGEDVESMFPWKVWKTKSDPNGARTPAVNFFQPNPMTDVLWSLFEKAFAQASEHTGIPAYVYGGASATKEAGPTASGMSMQINAAGKVLKAAVRAIDESIVKPAVKNHWISIMLYDPDEYKCGDITIVARASEHLIVAEQLQIRRTEFLREVANNQFLVALVGKRGLAAVLREVAKAMKMPPDEVVPSKEDIEAQEEQERIALENQPPPPPEGGAPPPTRGVIPMPTRSLTPAGGRPGEMTRMAA